jgi:hypothetical protein
VFPRDSGTKINRSSHIPCNVNIYLFLYKTQTDDSYKVVKPSQYGHCFSPASPSTNTSETARRISMPVQLFRTTDKITHKYVMLSRILKTFWNHQHQHQYRCQCQDLLRVFFAWIGLFFWFIYTF